MNVASPTLVGAGQSAVDRTNQYHIPQLPVSHALTAIEQAGPA